MNKFDYDTTLILFGRSPYINEIKNEIPLLIEKYHTMGCNYFCETFPDVEYVIFYDDITPKVKPETKIITSVKHYFNDEKICYNLCHQHKNIEFYTINKDDNEFSTGDSRLNFCIHTPSMALNWAYKNGFKTVILAGIDLIINTPHFDAETTPDANCPTFNESAIEKARKHLTDVASRYLKIYQLNPKSDIELEKITIRELLEQ
jgi:hypothetical protein